MLCLSPVNVLVDTTQPLNILRACEYWSLAAHDFLAGP